MGNIFSDLKTEGLEESQDRLGGFNIRDTDIYDATIKVAYAGKSDGGAHNVTVVALLKGDGSEYSETIYITNKKGENWFANKQDASKKVPLPGFTLIEDICLMTTGKTLSEQDMEEKIVKVYDYDEKKEIPKSVPVLTELTGQPIYLGIVREKVDRTKKDESSGEYEPTGETREQNTIEKVFHNPSKMTVVEARNQADEPVFFNKWLEKNKGNTRNRATGINGGTSGKPGNGGPPKSGDQEKKKTTSLFGK